MRKGWTGKDERLIDPAALSRDPNTSVDLIDVARDGSKIAYLVRQGGADETTVRVFDIKTRKTLEDELPSALHWSVNFTPDGTGLFYTSANRQGTLLYEHVLARAIRATRCCSAASFTASCWQHRPVFRLSDRRWPLPRRSDRSRRAAKRVDIVYRDLTKPALRSTCWCGT